MNQQNTKLSTVAPKIAIDSPLRNTTVIDEEVRNRAGVSSSKAAFSAAKSATVKGKGPAGSA